MCSADAQQALEGRRAAVAPRAWNRAAPVARPAQRPGAMSARRPADARGSAARLAQKPSARSARRPADARRSDARPSQRLSARCAQRPVEAVEPEGAVQLTCSCCSRCADEAQSIGRRNPPYAGWESQSRLRRSSRPERTAASCRGGSGSPKDAIDAVTQWALERSDDSGYAKIRCEARSEARCQSS